MSISDLHWASCFYCDRRQGVVTIIGIDSDVQIVCLLKLSFENFFLL
jgi:hypothetical protein